MKPSSKKLGTVTNKSVKLFKNVKENFFSKYKRKVAYRLFWGRSSLYKKFIHTCIFIVTFGTLLSSISSSYLRAQDINTTLNLASANNGNTDILEQGGSVEAVLSKEFTGNFTVIEHKLKKEDNLTQIAKKYKIAKQSLLLSNVDVVYYYDETFKEGDILKIPSINGILVKTEEDDNLSKLMGRIKKGNRLEIIEINGLNGPSYKLPKNSYVLVPDGDMDPPARRIPQVNYVSPVFSNAPKPTPAQAVLNGVHFIDPMYRCGYYWGRGYSGPDFNQGHHNGADLLSNNGCPISAAAAGVVTKVGFTPLEGFQVSIDHGNGVQTLYWHGNGNFYVRTGQTVAAGDPIMEVGDSGLAYGNHLHLCLRLNYQFIDPAPYIPYNRP